MHWVIITQKVIVRPSQVRWKRTEGIWWGTTPIPSLSLSVISSPVKIPHWSFSSLSAHFILMSSDLLLRWWLPMSGGSLKPLAITHWPSSVEGAEKQSHTPWNLNCVLFLKDPDPLLEVILLFICLAKEGEWEREVTFLWSPLSHCAFFCHMFANLK